MFRLFYPSAQHSWVQDLRLGDLELTCGGRKKAQAYSELVIALHNMRWLSREHFDALAENRTLSDEYCEELWQEFRKARKEVWKIAESSSFLISSEVMLVVEEMKGFLATARNVHSWIEHLELECEAIDKCLNKIKEIGAKELSIR